MTHRTPRPAPIAPRSAFPVALAAALVAAAALAPIPALASAYGESCSDPSGTLTADGVSIYSDDEGAEPLDYEVTLSVPVSESDTFCENAEGGRYGYGRRLRLDHVTYREADGTEARAVLLCEEVYDSFPVTADTTCVREFDTVNRRLEGGEMVDIRTEADRAALAEMEEAGGAEAAPAAQ